MILPKDKYIETIKRPYTPLWSSLIFAGMLDKSIYKPFFSKPYSRNDILLIDALWYYSIKTEEECKQLISDEWTNEATLNKVMILLREREKHLLESVDKPFAPFSKIYKEFQVSMPIVFLAEDPFLNKLRSALLKKITEDETNMLLDILNTPLEDNYFKQEELSLVMSLDIAKHVKEYEWIVSRYGSNTSYSTEEAEKRLKEIDKEKFLKEYYENKESVKKAIKRAKEILDPKDSYLVDGLQFIVFYRTHRTDVINRVKYEYIPVLTEMAKKFGISYEDIIFCTEEELLNENIPDKNIIEERKKGYIMAVIDEKIVCLIGDEYEKIKKDFEDNFEEQSEISGTVACKGKAVGKVKIINDHKDFGKIMKDDILVASMTTPEMMPMMKIASAFITDEGGITCHAAIVAREMKKPCIIGTKFATKVLKDGDVVEVNAEVGIVTIIKKANES